MCDKKKCSLIGLTMGILMSVMVIVFFLMYTTFTSLFSSLDLSHIYAYQITRLKMVNIYVNIIRFCFYAALLVAGIYVIKSLTMYRKNHRKIYLTTTIIGLVTLTSLILCLNFMVTLHNLGLFTHDLNTTQISELRVKYDYIVSLITQSSGFASLLSRAKLFVISGLIGFSNLALHAIYLLESAHHVVLESDDLKLSMTRIEKLLKQDEKIKIDRHTFKPAATSEADAKTIEFASLKDVPHYYEPRPSFAYRQSEASQAPVRVMKKSVVAVIVSIGIVLSCMGGYAAYDKYFNYINLDLISGLTFAYAGESGNGYITNFTTNIAYNDNPDVQAFMKSVKYHYDTRQNLSNGDEITVSATYNKELAKRRRIHILKDSKTYKVSGLVYRFADGNHVTKAIQKAIKSDAKEAFDKAFIGRYHNASSYSYDFESLWFAKGNKKSLEGDYAIGVFRVTCSYKAFYFIPRTISYDLYTYVGGVNSNYTRVKSSVNYRTPENRIYSAGNVFDEDTVKTKLQKYFPDTTLSKIA